MRTVLFDENVPRDLRRDLTGFDIRTVTQMGWSGMKNGELLRKATGSFHVLLTCDRSVQFQQNVAGMAIGVVVVFACSNRLEHLRPLVEKIRDALDSVGQGTVVHVLAD